MTIEKLDLGCAEAPTHTASDTPAWALRLSEGESDRLGDEIAELAAHLDAATHSLLTLIRHFDQGSGWANQGALGCAHWLGWRIGLELGAAREKVRVARALGALPLLDDALRLGQVSYSKVRAITRVATPENQGALLNIARCSTASQLERVCRRYRRARAGLEQERTSAAQDKYWRRFVQSCATDCGMVRIEAQLHPEEAAAVMKALEVATLRACGGGLGRPQAHDTHVEHVSAETRRQFSRADALVAVAEAYLSAEAECDAGSRLGGLPVEVIIHVDESSLRGNETREPDASAALDDGSPIPIETAERLACDAMVVRVVENAHSGATQIGRRTRRISPSLRRSLRMRDRTCRYPSCENRIADAHHIVPWTNGGETRLYNLCLLCRRHHRFVHERGYRIERDSRGEFRFFDASGVLLVAAPQPPRIEPGAAERLRVEHAAAGVVIDARTALPDWDGKPANYDHIVSCLMDRDLVPAARSAGTLLREQLRAHESRAV